MPIVLKFRSLNLLEPSRPVQASNGIALLHSKLYFEKLLLCLSYKRELHISLNYPPGLSKVASGKSTITNTRQSSQQVQTTKYLVPFKIRDITISVAILEDPASSIIILNHLLDTCATLWPANKLLQLKTSLWLK